MGTHRLPDVCDSPGEAFVHVSRPSSPSAFATQNDPIVIAVMGVTGSGKSSFIERVTGRQDVIVGHDLEACTQDIKTYPIEINGVTVTLVDTPGFNDTYKSDTQILVMLSKWLEMTYRAGIKLTAIIYLHSINRPRMEGSALMNLRMFRKLCGTDALGHVLLITTHWKGIELHEGERLESQLIDKFWGELIDRGAEYHRYDWTAKQARDIVTKAASRGRVKVAIQHEMVDMKMNLADTGAGKAVNEELTELKRFHKEELRELQKDMMDAIHASDQSAQEQIREERREQERKLELLMVEQEKLNRERSNETRQLELRLKAQLEDVMAQAAASEQRRAELEKIVEQLRAGAGQNQQSWSSMFEGIDWEIAGNVFSTFLIIVDQLISNMGD